MLPVGLGLLAGLATQDVVEAGAELGQEAAGDAQDEEDPQDDDQPEGEVVEEDVALVGDAAVIAVGDGVSDGAGHGRGGGLAVNELDVVSDAHGADAEDG